MTIQKKLSYALAMACSLHLSAINAAAPKPRETSEQIRFLLKTVVPAAIAVVGTASGAYCYYKYNTEQNQRSLQEEERQQLRVDFDDGEEKARVPIIVNSYGYSFDAEGNRSYKPGSNDPKINGSYTISIDETKTIRDLLVRLYDEPRLFEDTKTRQCVQGLSICDLSYGETRYNLMWMDPNTVLSTLDIRNGQQNPALEAEVGPKDWAPKAYKDLLNAHYERSSGEYIKGSEE